MLVMIVSIGKIAAIIGVVPSTLRRWDNQGILQADHRTVGGHRRYNLRRVVLWLQGKKETPS